MMHSAIVTGSAGLVGSAVVHRLVGGGFHVIGIDNDMRGQLFGPEASTHTHAEWLRQQYGDCYNHLSGDIRSMDTLEAIKLYTAMEDVEVVVHCASQPSHDWASKSPMVDFDINARATLQLLEWVRLNSALARVIYLSTNKVYGDYINEIEFVEQGMRWDVAGSSDLALFGIDEDWPIEDSTHSLFGVSKLAGDLLTQEYGRYFNLSTVCLRCGCLTGRSHRGAEQHGFLSYLAKCVREGRHYIIYGHKGKQVRDNLHAEDVAGAVWEILGEAPCHGEVFNMGGGRNNSISLLEAISWFEKLTGSKLDYGYDPHARKGDHRWWITDTRKFQQAYPDWRVTRTLASIMREVAKG